MLTTNALSQFSLGFEGRHEVGLHVSLVSDYYYLVDSLESINTFGAFILGVNWEVGTILL
jgi:hypothetical protein